MIPGNESAAIATIREAAEATQFDWTRVVRAGYSLTRYAIEQDLALQRERARDYWPVQCGDPLRGGRDLPRTTGVTWTVTDPATPDSVAVMVATPSETPVTTPSRETVATACALDSQAALRVIDCVRLG